MDGSRSDRGISDSYERTLFLDTATQGASEAVRQAALDGGLGEGVGLSLDSDYFNLCNFLADQTPVDVVTLDVCPFGGFADSNSLASGALHLQKGCRLQLPLATASILHDRGLVTLHLPPIFDESVLLNLRRNATVVDLRSLHPYYFEFGMKLASVFKDTQLARTLTAAAEERMIFLMQLACEEVESEQKALQTTSGLVAEGVLVGTTESRGAGGHMPSTGGSGYDPAGGIPGDTFSGKLGTSRLHSLDAGLFLKGLSISEAMVFQKRKEELIAAMSESFW